MSDRNENRPGYKKTKAGWIPEEWRAQLLGSITGKNQYGLSVSTKNEGQTPLLRMGNIFEGKVSYENLAYIDISNQERSKYLIQQNDLLFNRTNSLEHVGKLGIVSELIPAVFASYLVRFQIKDTLAFPPFIAYFLNTTESRNRLKKLATPGVCQYNINQTDLRRQFVIPLPPLSEQKKIAETLSTWDDAIEQTRKLIDANKRRKKALMQQLLTGKRQLPGHNSDWKSYRLKELLKQISRPVRFDDNAIYNLISVRRRSGGIFYRAKIAGHSILTKKIYTARSGDFLISKMQIVHGASALVDQEYDGMHISGSYIALRVLDPKKLDTNFLYWISKTPYFYHLSYLASYGVHIEKMTFNLRLFLKSEINIPECIDEQRRISEGLHRGETIQALSAVPGRIHSGSGTIAGEALYPLIPGSAKMTFDEQRKTYRKTCFQMERRSKTRRWVCLGVVFSSAAAAGRDNDRE